MMHNAWSSVEEVPYCSPRSYIKFQGHTAKKIVDFDPNWAFPDCNCYEMMHKAWSNIEEVPYYFSRSCVKFQGHTAPKIVDFDPNWMFPDCNSSLNSQMVTKWCTKLEVAKKRCPIVFQGHLSNSPMAMKCCTKIETAKGRCPIVFQGDSSNFKVTRDQTSPILTQIGRFGTIGWSQLSNPSDLHCLVCNGYLGNHAAVIWGYPDQLFTDGFEIMHKAWCDLQEMSYCFSRLSI